MAYQNESFCQYPWLDLPTSNLTVLTLDASGEKAAGVFRVAKTGSIQKIHFLLSTVTTGQTLKASLQDVDLATGDPDGTIDQSGTVAVADGDDNTWKTVTLGAVRAVSRGDQLSVVFEFDATIGNLQIVSGSAIPVMNVYTDLYTGTWAKQARCPLFILEYDDASIVPIPGVLYGLGTSLDFNSGSAADEVALRFSLPFPVRVMGLGLYGRVSGDVDLVLYSGTTALATTSLDKEVRQTSTDGMNVGLFSAAQECAKDTVYRAAVKPTSATSARVIYNDVSIAAHLDAAPGGRELHYSSRVDGGAWSDTTTRRPSIVLLIEGFDDGVSAGGLIGAGSIRGGFQ
jgi:hypothetical protein